MIVLAAGMSITPLLAIDPDRDFSGKWVFDPAGSNTRAIPVPQERFLTVVAQVAAIQCSSTNPDGSLVRWTYTLDGSETRYRIGDESRNSLVKWEGKALLVNTNVSSPQSYTISDRWTISRDRFLLTIERTVNQNGKEHEGVLHYRRDGQSGLPQEPKPAREPNISSNAPVPGSRPSLVRPSEANASPAEPAMSSIAPPAVPAPTLIRPSEPPEPAEIVVRKGTRIPLSLRNALDTKHSHEGDRVYLDTLYPVVVDNHIVIPRGSYVIGTLTISKPAGAVKGKGELFIRFDSLTMANGTTRDFKSRLASADTSHGTVDRQEGTITGERDKSGQAKTTAEGAGIGAGIGGLAGAAAGHPLSGVGIGAAAGAVVGLASVMNRHRADVVLPRGTTVEMLLDRDLYYLPSELPTRR